MDEQIPPGTLRSDVRKFWSAWDTFTSELFKSLGIVRLVEKLDRWLRKVA